MKKRYYIATTRFYAISPGEKRCSVTIRIGHPYEEDGCWACPVEMKGLFYTVRKVYGEDSFQALALALTLVKSLLRSKKSAGYEFSFGKSEGRLDPEKIWFPPINIEKKKTGKRRSRV